MIPGPGTGPSEPPFGADSAGFPWRGRELHTQPFAGDAGDPDPELVRELADYAAGRGDLTGLAAALAGSRLFVPIVAVLDEPSAHAAVLRTVGDSGADMALITLTGKDGSRALPVFSCVEAMMRWDGGARPVPVEAARAAQAAVAEGCDVLVLDLGSSPGAVVPRPVVWALGQGRAWVPPCEDPEVLDGVRHSVAGIPEVLSATVAESSSAELGVVLAVVPGLDQEALQSVTGSVRQRLAGSRAIAERAESVRLVITSLRA